MKKTNGIVRVSKDTFKRLLNLKFDEVLIKTPLDVLANISKYRIDCIQFNYEHYYIAIGYIEPQSYPTLFIYDNNEFDKYKYIKTIEFDELI